MTSRAKLRLKEKDMSERNIERNFNFHETNEDQSKRIQQVTSIAKIMASVIEENIPKNTRERALAITNLEQCKMWAVSAISKEHAYLLKEEQDKEKKIEQREEFRKNRKEKKIK